MGSVSIVVPPDHTTLVELDDFKAEIDITGTSDDAVLSALLGHATGIVDMMLAPRPIQRGQYRQTIRGSGRSRLSIAMRPIASLDAVSYQGSALSLSEFEIDSREGGIIYRTAGVFTDDCDPNGWEITATSGWFVPDDDLSGSISVAAVDKSYNSSALLFPTHLKAGDVFIASGFTDPANNGPRTVVTATTSKITVVNTLVDEASGTRAMGFDNLPSAINRAITDLAREDYLNRSSASGGGALVEESISGATTLRYSSSVSTTVANATDSAKTTLFPLMDW